MPGEIRKIAAFLEIPIDESTFPTIVEHCTFEYMKSNKDIEGIKEFLFQGNFFNKGTNGRWKELLSQADCEEYERKAIEEVGQEAADWLKTGQLPK